MKAVDLELQGLKLISPSLFQDDRGFFFESYKNTAYFKEGITTLFVQDNVSFSCKNTIRGLHFQSFPGQAKLVSCLHGKIWDVAVDIRKHSSTFGKWEAVELDSLLHQQLFIPEGFAHGFCVLSQEALVQYKVSSVYDPKTECAIRWNDPDLAISWPCSNPILSQRDHQSPFFKEVFSCGFGLQEKTVY